LTAKPPRRRLSLPLASKRQRSPQVFNGYESFVYLLTELEAAVDSGTIRWSATTAAAAKIRLGLLEKALGSVMRQIGNEGADQK
jgi:hypothetical protein